MDTPDCLEHYGSLSVPWVAEAILTALHRMTSDAGGGGEGEGHSLQWTVGGGSAQKRCPFQAGGKKG